MKKAVVWGFGGTYRRYKDFIRSRYHIEAIVDNQSYEECILPAGLKELQYDVVIVCVLDFLSVVRQLLFECEVPSEKIDLSILCEMYRLDRCYVDGDNHIIAKANGISIFVETHNDLGTFREVVINKQYDIRLPRKSVVIDAGLNIGTASLFFLRQENIEKVYAYEPFPTTFEKAVRNLQLNSVPLDKGKIECFNVALGASEEDIMVETVTLESKGSNTILPPNALHRSYVGEEVLHEVRISVLNAAVEVKKIKEKHPTCNIIMKLDVEGSEYAIIQSLLEGDALQYIDALVMEFHPVQGKDFQRDIVDVLIVHNFAIYNGTNLETYLAIGNGYIVAVKRTER